MSVTFYGRTSDGAPIVLDIEHPAFMNLSCANASAFLLFLGLEPGADLSGQVSLPEARRAIIRARATFDCRVGAYTRAACDVRMAGHVRMIEGGVGADYFERRLDDFERFVDAVVEQGAISDLLGVTSRPAPPSFRSSAGAHRSPDRDAGS